MRRGYWKAAFALAVAFGAAAGIVGALGWESPLAGALLGVFVLQAWLAVSLAIAALVWILHWVWPRVRT